MGQIRFRGDWTKQLCQIRTYSSIYYVVDEFEGVLVGCLVSKFSVVLLGVELDCLLYRTITTDEDTSQLQRDLDQLQEWATKWQLRFNVSKCTIMRFTKSLFTYPV